MAKSKKMKLPINEVLGVVAGAVAAGFISKLINDKAPTMQPQLKSLIPIGAGIFLASNKNIMIKGIGFGMVGKGANDLAASLLPASITGVDDVFLSSPADQSILSAPMDQSILSGGDDFMNGDDDFMNGDDEFMNGDDEFMNGDEDFLSAIEEVEI